MIIIMCTSIEHDCVIKCRSNMAGKNSQAAWWWKRCTLNFGFRKFDNFFNFFRATWCWFWNIWYSPYFRRKNGHFSVQPTMLQLSYGWLQHWVTSKEKNITTASSQPLPIAITVHFITPYTREREAKYIIFRQTCLTVCCRQLSQAALIVSLAWFRGRSEKTKMWVQNF
jgi:hypothetical protein